MKKELVSCYLFNCSWFVSAGVSNLSITTGLSGYLYLPSARENNVMGRKLNCISLEDGCLLGYWASLLPLSLGQFTLMMAAARRLNLEVNDLQTHHWENLKSYCISLNLTDILLILLMESFFEHHGSGNHFSVIILYTALCQGKCSVILYCCWSVVRIAVHSDPHIYEFFSLTLDCKVVALPVGDWLCRKRELFLTLIKHLHCYDIWGVEVWLHFLDVRTRLRWVNSFMHPHMFFVRIHVSPWLWQFLWNLIWGIGAWGQ